jgi:putative PIN family toxin of toxin-antitoxin system
VRIFADTNVLISALITRGLCADLIRFILARHYLLTGEINIAELERVLRKRLHATNAQWVMVERWLQDLEVVARPAAPSKLDISDPDDRWVLASAVDGRADILVTGDRDLLAVADQAPMPIVNPRGCWEQLRGGK